MPPKKKEAVILLASLMQTVLKCVLININGSLPQNKWLPPSVGKFSWLPYLLPQWNVPTWSKSHIYLMWQHSTKERKKKTKQKKPGRINDGDEGSWILNGTSFLKSCAPDCVLVKAICFWYNASPTRHAPSHDARALSCGSFVPWLVARLPALGVHAPVE